MVAPLCRRKIIIASDVMRGISEPITRFLGQVEHRNDGRSWWAFTQSSLADILRRVGFRDIADVGTYAGIHRRALHRYERLVIHAVK